MPPPLLFGAALLTGFLFDQVVDWHFPAPRAVAVVAGAVLAGIGIILSVTVTWLFVRARTPISTRSQATALVIEGPYRFSRNPDYVGQALLSAGIALMLDWPVALVAIIAVMLVVHNFVVPREERSLEQRFGDEYRNYARRVRRWL